MAPKKMRPINFDGKKIPHRKRMQKTRAGGKKDAKSPLDFAWRAPERDGGVPSLESARRSRRF